MIAQLAVIVWAGGLAYEDWRWRRLPNVLLAAGVVLGLVHWAAYGAMPFGATISDGAVAAVLGLAALLPFYRAGWMGAGDVKLSAVIGWLGGLQILLAVFLVACMVAGGLAIMLLSPACRRFMGDHGLDRRLGARVPFGVGLAGAVMVLAAVGVTPGALRFW
ncbi:MAG: A24 family peptidase [Sulfuricella sp.]|nr:A24 family peptidase [Sulfuricella sp.]